MECTVGDWIGSSHGGLFTMRKPPPDYAKIEQQLWNEFAADVPRELRDGEKRLNQAIERFCKHFGYNKDDVKAHILESEMFAATFSKEPRRTGYHEKAARNWLKELEHVTNFKKLKSSGRDSLYVKQGGEIGGPPEATKRASSKSLDFQWETGRYTVYAMHKYNTETGGHQMGQYDEIRKTLQMFNNAGAKDTEVLIAIVDGEIYSSDRLNELRRYTRQSPPHSFAGPIEEVPSILKYLMDLNIHF